MDELAKYAGVGSLCAILGYFVRLLLDQRLRKELEDYKHGIQREVEGHKHTLAVLAKRLDFLNQERGKAALALVRLMKTAKMHVKLLVDLNQLGPVDQEKACRDSHAACGEVHNLIADSSFLFPKSLEDQMLKTRSALWTILDEATLLFQNAKAKGQSPSNDPRFQELWKKLRAEFEPLEAAMIAEIRALLGAADEDLINESSDRGRSRA